MFGMFLASLITFSTEVPNSKLPNSLPEAIKTLILNSIEYGYKCAENNMSLEDCQNKVGDLYK